jgi:uncharacterized protein (DUF362 family)|nr:DUF362 domain-containing protein [Kofleriaceae bacterium]
MRFVSAALLMMACSRGDEPKPLPPAPPVAVAPDAAAADAARPVTKQVPVPDVTSAASPTHQAGPRVVADGKVDGAALRARHRERLAADTSAVTVLSGGTPRELGKRLCEAVVPQRAADTPILIKPNLTGFDWFHDPKTHHGDDGVTGRITDPEFVHGIVDCLKARGHTNITIADGFTGVAADWRRLVTVSGYGAMAKDAGVPLVALDDDGVFDKQGDQPGKPLAVTGMENTGVPTLLMPKLVADVLDHGLFITAPKLKAHRFSVVSLGIKGMQGTAMYSDAAPAFRQKWRTHREIDGALQAVQHGAPDARASYVKALETFADRIADILEVESPDVELAEGAPAMDGDGFEQLVPRAGSLAIGGTNVIAVDKVGAQALGLWDSDALAKELGGHRTSPLIETAAKRFGVDLGAVKLAGDGAALLAEPRAAYLVAMAGFAIDTRGAPAAIHAAHAAAAPTVDGKIDDAWAAAPVLEFAQDWKGRPAPVHTKVRFLWTQSALYALFELDDAGFHTDHSKPIDVERKDLYEEDCVELFVAPDAEQRRKYAEIELGPFGHFFDIWVDREAKTSDEGWSAKLTIATARDAATHHAIIEVAIAAPEIVAALTAGARLPVGVYRIEAKTYLAAFPTRTPKPNFHVPEAFGELVLDP